MTTYCPHCSSPHHPVYHTAHKPRQQKSKAARLARGEQVMVPVVPAPEFIDWSMRQSVDTDTIFDGCEPIVKAVILPPIPPE